MREPVLGVHLDGTLASLTPFAGRGEKPPFDPLAPEFARDPYPTYRRMRVDHPVHFLPPRREGEPGAWYVFRHADVNAVLRDPRFGREAPSRRESGRTCPMALQPYFEMKRRWILFRDPPYHTRVRSVVQSALTPALVEAFTPRIDEIANELIDVVEPRGTMDVIADYAFPFAVRVIAELLGVSRDDLRQFTECSGAMAAAVDLRQSSTSYEQAGRTMQMLADVVRPLVEHRTRQPGADLVSALLATRAGGADITDDELLAMCVLLLLSGHETSVKLIGNAIWALLEQPAIWEALGADPELLPTTVDELIRYAGPVHLTDRIALDDVELRDCSIRQGQQVWAVVGSANRDPEVFPDPDRLLPTRRSVAQRGFGLGIHYCIGAHLARCELLAALRVLIGRCGHLQPVVERVQWYESIVLRGIKTFPVVL